MYRSNFYPFCSEAVDTLHDRLQSRKQAVGTLIDHIFTSIEQRIERETAAKESLRELAKELQPYLKQKTASNKVQQELSEIDGALVDAQQMLDGPPSAVDAKKSEIDRIRDEINSEKLNNAANGRQPMTVEVAKKSNVLNEITGASSWQTATWVMIAITMVLTVCILGLTAYQAAQKRKYEKIHGNGIM
ncbi:hypothetical protein Q1695_011554 [Nippostrongylus brasiliensis]|nr:hypothetical protein Q1695_011554 [Nippostrongylus brasiliensis]